MGELDVQLRQLLRACGLAHLAFYDRDRARMVAAEHPASPDGPPAEPASRDLEHAGRQLFYILEELAPDFAELRTGALIRTVVRVPTGALLYQSVAAGFHLCCTTRQDGVEDLVARMTEGIDALRPAVPYGLLPRHSFLSRRASPARGPAAGFLPGAAESGAPYTVNTSADPGAEGDPDPTTDLLCAALGVHGLHYVALHDGSGPTRAADILGHPALRTLFGGATPQQRRDKYGLLGQLLPGVTGRMNTSLHALLEGEIQQIVLKVEQGAVYFRHLRARHYLLGVALDQSRLPEADRHIERLGRELAAD